MPRSRRSIRFFSFFSFLSSLLLLLPSCSSPLSPPPPSAAEPLGSVDRLPPTTEPTTPVAVKDGDWPQFGRTADRRGFSPLRFPSTAFRPLWSWRPSEHVFRYRRGTNLWSESPVAVESGGRTLLLVGSYDRTVQCLDAATGERLWRHVTGDEVTAAPLLLPAEPGGPLAVVCSTDRSVYGLALADGERRWLLEAQGWAHTVEPARFTSPVAVRLAGESFAAGGVFLNDVARGGVVQDGVAALWRARDGAPAWRQVLRRSPLAGPAAAVVDGRPVLFYGSADGCVAALDARDGRCAWRFTADEGIRGTPAVATTTAGPVVLAASAWGMLWALDARDGAPRFSFRAGHRVDASPCVAPLPGGGQVVVVGSWDRYVHGVDLASGRSRWRTLTGNEVVGTAAAATAGERTVVFVPSLDSRLYCLDAGTGAVLWSYEFGSLPWPHVRRGDAVFSSPIVCRAGGRTLLVHAAHDAVVYAFAADS